MLLASEDIKQKQNERRNAHDVGFYTKDRMAAQPYFILWRRSPQ